MKPVGKPEVKVIGGGLAGCEAAWQLALRGFRVALFEMRPSTLTPAHTTGDLAELVCSNSLRSADPVNAAGLLKSELEMAGSFVLSVALGHAVPAGSALAVDRHTFSSEITGRIERNPGIELVREEVTDLEDDRFQIVATGPLTSDLLALEISNLAGSEELYFYDALAPIVEGDGIDRSIAFLQSRYDSGEGAYLNCPMSEKEYFHFVDALLSSERAPLREFEKKKHFSGCLPVEVIGESGALALAHGPMKPVGLIDPRTGERPFAVVQLRMENKEGTAWNLVGFQTQLTYPAQKRLFRSIPGLGKAVFLRLGSMHRNTYLNSPQILDSRLRMKGRENVLFAGQITGVEGYMESVASGWLCGYFLSSLLDGVEPVPPPPETALGALLSHVTTARGHEFQPSNINYGLFPATVKGRGRREKRAAYSKRALESLGCWMSEI